MIVLDRYLGVDSPLMDECHSSYSQSLIALHQRIMTLYENYQQCQSRAAAIFHGKSKQIN